MKNFLSVKKKKAIIFAVAAGVCFGLPQVNAADSPAFFDWRLTNPTDSNSGEDALSIVSPVESQKHGTCWTFGTFSSYESSWMKQLKAAQAAGYNVTPARNIFSKYYLAWMANMPAVDNSNDTAIRRLLSYTPSSHKTDHPIYDQGGNVEKSVSALVNYGAIDESDGKRATSDEEIDYAKNAMDTEANWNRIKEYTKSRLAIDYIVKNYDYKNMSPSELEKIAKEYIASLPEETINEEAQNDFNLAAKSAIMTTVEPKGNLHDAYSIHKEDSVRDLGLSESELNDVKEALREEGVLFVSHKAATTSDSLPLPAYLIDGEVDPSPAYPTHAESLVGYDDDYVFKNYTDSDGNPLKGAFIMKNSWGTTFGPYIMANEGYAYLSYKDASVGAVEFFNAELDGKRYTINQNNAPAIDTVDYIGRNFKPTTQAIANSFTAGTDSGQFLKAVTFYASEKNMPYEIVVREGETPGVGAILTKQSGTFGEDGSAKWAGYRTVDLNNYVFLAKDKKYTVEVRTTSPTGSTVSVAFMAGQDVKMDGESYFYYDAGKTWIKTDKMRQYNDDETSATTSTNVKADNEYPTGYDGTTLDPSLYKQIYIYTVARNKESAAANGGDFTVSYLDDSDTSGSSVVNLGSATELYGSDNANPDRKTLSNMTVDLSEDSYNAFKGSIIGEGSVTKTGEGFLALNGANTYTGGTFVNNGRLEVNGSITGDATVTDNGAISGKGEIGGALINHAAAVAGNIAGDGDLTVNSLESSGKLVTQGENKFIVKTTANVEGSTITTTYAKPDEEVTVVEADSVTGNVKNNSTENAEKLSAMLESYAEVTDKKVILKTDIKNNIGELNASENEGFYAVKNMSVALKGDSRKDELMPLLYLDSANAKSALSAMGNNIASDMYAATQRSAVVNGAIRERAFNAFNADNNDVRHNGWVKYTKNWGDLKSGANYHSQGIVGGYDEAIGKNWRGGVFVGYNAMGLGKTNASGNIYDTRFGLYALYHKGVNDAYIYADYGEAKNRLYRGIPNIGVSTEAKYDSSLFEIGGEFKRNLQPNKIWNVSPFVNLQYTHLKQDAYNEKNGGIFNHHVKGKSGNYLAGLVGVEFKRNFARGSYAARVGVKHAFTKLDGALDYSYEGDSNNVYTMKNNQNRTHFVLSLAGENEFAKGWILGGDFQFEKGGSDKNLAASLMLKKVW